MTKNVATHLLLWEHFHLCLLYMNAFSPSSLLHRRGEIQFEETTITERARRVAQRIKNQAAALGGLREKGKQEVPNFAASSQAHKFGFCYPRARAFVDKKCNLHRQINAPRALCEQKILSLSLTICDVFFWYTSPEGGGCHSLICERCIS